MSYDLEQAERHMDAITGQEPPSPWDEYVAKRERLKVVKEVRDCYRGSDAAKTLALMDRLNRCGIDGQLGALLWKAQKNSSRAKKYRKRTHSRVAYERKNDTINAVARFLESIGAEAWGWGRDHKAEGFTHVLYVDLPGGQCSFHSPSRGPGRSYDGDWDARRRSEDVILEFCESVLSE